MQYLIYFTVTTPLLLAWLFWQTAGVPPPPPMFHSFANTVHAEAMLKREAKQVLHADIARERVALARAKHMLPAEQAKRAMPRHYERTTRVASRSDIRLR